MAGPQAASSGRRPGRPQRPRAGAPSTGAAGRGGGRGDDHRIAALRRTAAFAVALVSVAMPIAARLGAIKSYFWRWQKRLPSPFSAADLRAGYVYDLAFRQIEFSDTRVFDRPQAGRSFFEGVIRDNLDLGRPDQVAILFERAITKRTPGTFCTKVITKGVDPEISIYYRSSRLKQYFKESKALRTETVICDTRDFGIGRRVCAENFHALRAVGNARACPGLALLLGDSLSTAL